MQLTMKTAFSSGCSRPFKAHGARCLATRPLPANRVLGYRAVDRRPLTGRTRAAFNPNDIHDLKDIPQQALYAGGAVLVSLLGLFAAATQNQQKTDDAGTTTAATVEPVAAPAPIPRDNAVLVFGATGRMGRLIINDLVKAGRTVVVAARSADKAGQVLSELGLKEGYQGQGKKGGIVVVEAGVDVTKAQSLTKDLFKGVTQVVSALGPVYGRLPDGSFGYIDGMSPDKVEASGMANIVAAMEKYMTPDKTKSSTILPMTNEEELATWERLDDVIMGGNSSSSLEAAEGGAVWKGDLVVEGGGFCGTRTKKLGLDLSAYDGLRLRVKGDGQTFKFNIKTVDQEETPESTYQATFDTSPEGDWTTVTIPWHNFVPVQQAQWDPTGAPLGPSQISKLGLVLSRFEFNKMPNPTYKPGPFELRIAGGIAAYRAPRPQLLVVSSAGVERNAIIGDDAAARKKDIPIVQLNPGGVLNYKYEAECAARASGFPYTVIRATGLESKGEEPACLLEADQGDIISGKVTRPEVASLIAVALNNPEATGKTFELRRSEAADALGKEMTPKAYNRLFLKLAPDTHRWRVGLGPLPKAVPPPPPPTEERTKEILADPRVQEARQRENARRDAEAAKQSGPGPQEGKESKEESQEAAKQEEPVTANA